MYECECINSIKQNNLRYCFRFRSVEGNNKQQGSSMKAGMFRSVGSHSGSSSSGTEPVKVQRSRTPQQIKAEKAARAAEEVSAAPVTQPLEPNKLPRFGVQENVYVLKEETMAGVKQMTLGQFYDGLCDPLPSGLAMMMGLAFKSEEVSRMRTVESGEVIIMDYRPDLELGYDGHSYADTCDLMAWQVVNGVIIDAIKVMKECPFSLEFETGIITPCWFETIKGCAFPNCREPVKTKPNTPVLVFFESIYLQMNKTPAEAKQMADHAVCCYFAVANFPDVIKACRYLVMKMKRQMVNKKETSVCELQKITEELYLSIIMPRCSHLLVGLTAFGKHSGKKKSDWAALRSKVITHLGELMENKDSKQKEEYNSSIKDTKCYSANMLELLATGVVAKIKPELQSRAILMRYDDPEREELLKKMMLYFVSEPQTEVQRVFKTEWQQEQDEIHTITVDEQVDIPVDRLLKGYQNYCFLVAPCFTFSSCPGVLRPYFEAFNLGKETLRFREKVLIEQVRCSRSGWESKSPRLEILSVSKASSKKSKEPAVKNKEIEMEVEVSNKIPRTQSRAARPEPTKQSENLTSSVPSEAELNMKKMEKEFEKFMKMTQDALAKNQEDISKMMYQYLEPVGAQLSVMVKNVTTCNAQVQEILKDQQEISRKIDSSVEKMGRTVCEYTTQQSTVGAENLKLVYDGILAGEGQQLELMETQVGLNVENEEFVQMNPHETFHKFSFLEKITGQILEPVVVSIPEGEQKIIGDVLLRTFEEEMPEQGVVQGDTEDDEETSMDTEDSRGRGDDQDGVALDGEAQDDGSDAQDVDGDVQDNDDNELAQGPKLRTRRYDGMH